jgi:hypothetical protein
MKPILVIPIKSGMMLINIIRSLNNYSGPNLAARTKKRVDELKSLSVEDERSKQNDIKRRVY